MAKLYFRYGAMNSGKSTALMQVAHNYEEQGMRVLILKPQIDSKGGGELVSRLGVRRKADLLIRPTDDVFAAVEADREAHSIPLACVLCDESQFFTPAQAEQLFMVTVDLGVPVICYGLRTDFSLKGFPGSTRLMELAHTIEEMKTICSCGRKAICNARTWKTMSNTSACVPSAISGNGAPFTPPIPEAAACCRRSARGLLRFAKRVFCFGRPEGSQVVPRNLPMDRPAAAHPCGVLCSLCGLSKFSYRR